MTSPAAFPGAVNMSLDAAMIAMVGDAGGSTRASRVFRWERPAVSLPRNGMSGVDEPGLAASGIEVVRRPTGGGALIHGSDVSFSVAMRSPRGKSLDLVETGRMLAGPVRRGLHRLGIRAEFRDCAECDAPGKPSPLCFLQRTPFDLLVAGRKVASFALRRTGTVLFIHGSVLVGDPPEAAVTGLARAGLPEALRWSVGGVSLAAVGGAPGPSAVGAAIAESNDSPLFSLRPPLAGATIA